MTHQPQALTAADTVDEIIALMGPMGAAEFDERAKLRSCRDIACYRVGRTESSSARTLYWLIVDMVNGYLFAHAELIILAEAAQYCERLLKVAEQAHYLEVGDANG